MRFRSLFRYAFLPELFSSNRRSFGLGRLLGALLVSGRVLPPHAPVLHGPQVRVLPVLGAAFNAVPLRRTNLDKLAFLFAVVAALVLLAVQAIGLVLMFAIPAASAAETGGETFAPSFLSSVLGSSELFGAGSMMATSPLISGLYAMLGLYSTMLMIVATIIVAYFIICVVGEAAQSGTPFGRRFNGLYAPLRLVLALGLLVPLGAGLNAAQYVTLYAAKYGSEKASEVWRVYTDRVKQGPTIGAVAVPAITGLVRGIFMSEVCAAALKPDSPAAFQPRVIYDAGGGSFGPASSKAGVALQAEAVKLGTPALSFHWAEPWNYLGKTRGYVAPCGEVTVKASKGEMPAFYASEVLQIADAVRPLAVAVAQAYPAPPPALAAKLDSLPAALNQIALDAQGRISAAVASGAKAAGGAVRDDEKGLGWVAAGVHYASLAKATRLYSSVVRDYFPTVSRPVTAASFDAASNEAKFDNHARMWAILGVAEMYAERLAVPPAPTSSPDAVVDAASFWSLVFKNPIEATLNFVFGITPLRELRANPDAEPLTALSSAGSHLVTRSLVVFSVGLGADLGGSLLKNLTKREKLGAVVSGVGSFMLAIASIGLMAGIMLLYVLPLLPFVYFFFALLGWLFSLIEAMVGVPLWALAHLRIDGDGLSGQAASGGYFLLFEIFLRPLMIVLAAVLSYLAFTGGIWALAWLFDLAVNDTVSSLQDKAAPSGLDSFIYTIIFALMAYGVGVSSFKLIDKLPNEVLRWLGSGARPFNGGNDAPDLRGSVLAGGAAVAGVTSGLQGASAQAKSGFEAFRANRQRTAQTSIPTPPLPTPTTQTQEKGQA